jgi:TrmH family RNA methyltransferase
MAEPPLISSRRHPLVLACREARGGGDTQPVLLDGWHLLVEATAAAIEVDAVLVGAAAPGASERAALATLVERGAQVVRVIPDVLHAASPVRTPSGVVALARRPSSRLEAVFLPTPALTVVLIDVQDPGNVGAVVRTAEAAGASGVIAAGVSADPFGWKAVRASMGSALRLPIARLADTGRLVALLRAHAVGLVALVPVGGRGPDAIDLRPPIALLLGGEGAGLPADVLAAADERLQLPMRPPVESLNVAVAGALAVYAAASQRKERA